jgi:protein ImuB
VDGTASLIRPIPSPRTTKEVPQAQEIERILAILHQWGIHTLGQLAALDRNELAARFGTAAVKLWQRANGRAQRILKLVSPPESFVESFEFENEIETVEPLLFMLRRFLEQLATRLNAIYLVAKELRLRITFTDKSHYERVFKIPQPTNNAEVLFRMLHTHLENFTSQHPITSVELEAQPSRPSRQQFGLFETALRAPAQLHDTLTRLVGLLGEDRVGTPVLEETHRPDAFRMEPFAWEIRDEPGSGGCPRMAIRRFRHPAVAAVLLNENKPVHLRAAGIEGEIVMQAGPYPLSGNWWDEHAWARVEWDVEVANGPVLRCHSSNGRWAVGGIYD